MGDVIENVARWIKYGVLLSFAPLGLVWLLSTIAGYDIDIMETAPDIILIGFAVAVNTLCYETDKYKKINDRVRKIFENISRCIMILCLVLYYGLFNYEFLGEEIKQKLLERKQIVFFVAVGVGMSVLVNAVLGSIIEYNSSKSTDNQQENIQAAE